MSDNDTEPADEEHRAALERALELLIDDRTAAYQVVVYRDDGTAPSEYYIHDAFEGVETDLAGAMLAAAVAQVGDRFDLDFGRTLDFAERYEEDHRLNAQFDVREGE